jgi:Peptidase family M48
MSRKLTFLLLLLVISVGLVDRAPAQQCNPPAITANTKNYNIFSPEQEMIVGELINNRMSGDLRFLRDAQLQKYLDDMSKRLVKHLPPIGLKFQFYIVDIPEANAFNIPGGYVFVSRKLIGFANSEDELAGVVAHELGHAVVRHGATGLSELMKKILNVTQVGDRKDVTEKYNLLMERQRTKNVSRSSDHESAQQLEADRIGLFAMVAAGYDPNAFASLFDRLVETKGKTGNWFSDIFGRVKPEQKRLREMIKITDQLPAECRENRANVASNAFLNWQAEVVSYHEATRAEQLSGILWKKQLVPGLRSDISHFAFSPDGSFFLAQDDFGITVIRREPLTVEFQIPITEAQEASFTPDGRFIVFGTEALRFEKWSLADKKAVEIRELVIRRDCWEHKFSPDGKYLACLDLGLNLNVLETQTGKKVFEKKEFYQLSFLEYLNWIIRSSRREGGASDTGFFRIVYSPDSRYLAVSRSEFFRYSIRIDGMVAAESENTLLALDLNTLKPVGVGGDLKKVSRRPFIFLGPDRVVGSPSAKVQDAGVFSFPDGKRVTRFLFSAQIIKHTANPKYLIIKPLANAKLGVFDLSQSAIVSGFNKPDVTIWNNIMVFEGVSGRVIIGDLRYNEEKKTLEMSHSQTLDIPAATVDGLNVAEVSDNFQWLAVSSKTRGGLWNLGTGERKLFVRGFAGALLGNDGGAIGDFPKEAPANHSLALLNAVNGQVSVLRELPDRGAKQYGRFVLVRESLDKPSAATTASPSAAKEDAEDVAGKTSEYSLSSNVRMLLRDVINDKLMWSRGFPKEVPRYFFDKFSGRLIFYWTLGSNAGKSRLNQDPELATRARTLGNTDDDYLLEVIDAFAGKTIGTMLLETGKGSFEILNAYSEGNWLVLHDSTNRVLAFSIKDGELQQRFFGSNAAVNPIKNQVAVENYPGELTIYNLTSGDHESRLLFSGRIAFVRFSLDGKRLFVLTDQQTAYAFDVERIARIEPATSTASNP